SQSPCRGCQGTCKGLSLSALEKPRRRDGCLPKSQTTVVRRHFRMQQDTEPCRAQQVHEFLSEQPVLKAPARKRGDDVIRSLSGVLDNLTGNFCNGHRKPIRKAPGDGAGLLLLPQVRKQRGPHWPRFEPKHTRLCLALDGERVCTAVLRNTRKF